jgi:hypothetical protein
VGPLTAEGYVAVPACASATNRIWFVANGREGRSHIGVSCIALTVAVFSLPGWVTGWSNGYELGNALGLAVARPSRVCLAADLLFAERSYVTLPPAGMSLLTPLGARLSRVIAPIEQGTWV